MTSTELFCKNQHNKFWSLGWGIISLQGRLVPNPEKHQIAQNPNKIDSTVLTSNDLFCFSSCFGMRRVSRTCFDCLFNTQFAGNAEMINETLIDSTDVSWLIAICVPS